MKLMTIIAALMVSTLAFAGHHEEKPKAAATSTTTTTTTVETTTKAVPAKDAKAAKGTEMATPAKDSVKK